jgi:hypothetical protein
MPFGLNQSGPIIGEQRENIKPAPPALAIDRAYQARRSHCNAIDSAVLIKKINWTPSPAYQRESIPCCLIALNRSPTMSSLIVVTYKPATDTKGARLRVTCGDFKPQIHPYPYGYEGLRAFECAAATYADSMGWHGINLAGGWIKTGAAGFALVPYSTK